MDSQTTDSLIVYVYCINKNIDDSRREGAIYSLQLSSRRN